MGADLFAHKAAGYEQEKRRTDVVTSIAEAILESVPLNQNMHLMDFGSGTGLLLERVATKVGKITAVDISPAMNARLEEKKPALPCELELMPVDLAEVIPQARFDGVISSMTLHHVENLPVVLSRLYTVIADKGFLALADLELEDGSFHDEADGVFHKGFDCRKIMKLVSVAGFKDVELKRIHSIPKNGKDYPVFLLTARK
ncbi:class I SAM-dependent methyltransferase [Endozoicomonas sp. OPT23]|uniref:class I SAM-dependent DNA methyltransferase n=1 Tax=Endozoicomonas sp. OPT23 TaxID=2072845 RepID=UPI00129AF631|nr:class I SAM-dependent methyltransferase [Endozoicomonas sp. OPT23]MRI35464.1 class I SAM-dependent methyltransferase [Endozoicomonas sp. OPT23]